MLWGPERGSNPPAFKVKIMTFRPLVAVLAAIVLTAGASYLSAQTPPSAASPSLVGQYGDWGVYVAQNPRTKICFALTQPKERLPAALKRDPAYLFIASRPGENVRNEVSMLVGFPLKDESEATLEVGGASFALYTRKDGAWIRNVAEEARLVDSLRKGRDFTVKSTSSRGNVTTDRYSLSGVSQALDRAAQECR